MDTRTIVFRLALATVLGGILGFEREVNGQNAGLRTHMIVALGSCCFTLASIFTEVRLGEGVLPEGTQTDISRIASQVVVGIGFLGAGVILRQGGTVTGLTTAANLWLTASVGMTSGMGFYAAAGGTVGLALLSLVALRPVERAILRYRVKHGRTPMPPFDD
ncbi:MgtC/SapB family protein [Corallococcus sp. H22C18031201]|uniref:MgtC/SapB family protein n=1 Tax=Citreicoccus inhibens TaxID=2849499 RepID=UPI000E70FC66|nr:MgtC/SapB family protein [Citreicoccus inhibens]MBU8895574.1 MgtC/SapB family protein [Citreicoccus inhibens]RJS22405.1 MgtC/SapB family protein [Corallococcus sp. H22C18031201]